jgi:hypothetical protein
MISLNYLTEIEPYCKEEIEFVTLQKHVGLCEINTQFFSTNNMNYYRDK